MSSGDKVTFSCNECEESNDYGITQDQEIDYSILSLGGKNFYRFCKGESIGSITGYLNDSSTILKIFHYDDYMLEKSHSFIQWVFPTITPSAYNGYSPILFLSDYLILRNSKLVISTLNFFALKMLSYWGLNGGNRSFLTLLHGHNGLRLSRAIESLTLFGFDLSKIMNELKELIRFGILNPRYDLYLGLRIPIWFIRYEENKELVIGHEFHTRI